MDMLEDVFTIAWNIQGALGKNSRCQVRVLVNHCHPSSTVERIWHSLGYNKKSVQEARKNLAFWILACMNDRIFNLINSMFQSITFSISKGIIACLCFSTIYASPTYSARAFL